MVIIALITNQGSVGETSKQKIGGRAHEQILYAMHIMIILLVQKKIETCNNSGTLKRKMVI